MEKRHYTEPAWAPLQAVLQWRSSSSAECPTLSAVVVTNHNAVVPLSGACEHHHSKLKEAMMSQWLDPLFFGRQLGNLCQPVNVPSSSAIPHTRPPYYERRDRKKPGRCSTYTCSYVLCACYPTTKEPLGVWSIRNHAGLSILNESMVHWNICCSFGVYSNSFSKKIQFNKYTKN